MEDMLEARYRGGQDSSMPFPSVLRSLNHHVFTSLEDCQTLYSWDFMEASPHGPEQLLTPFLLPLPSLEDEE